MGLTDHGEHAERGTDDVVEDLHLAWLADTGLEDGQLGLGVKEPKGEGHADLRIVAAGGTRHDMVLGEGLIEPLLDHSLAVAARDAYHGDSEALAMACGQLLEGSKRVANDQERGVGIVCLPTIGNLGDNEATYATLIEFGDIVLPVIARGAQGKEQGLFRKTERATVGQQKTNVSSTLAIALRPHHRGDFLY